MRLLQLLLSAALMGLPITSAETSSLLQKAQAILQQAGVPTEGTHYLPEELYVQLAVRQAGLPAESTGATLRVRLTAGAPLSYEGFVRLSQDSDPLLLATTVAHEQVHVLARRRGQTYTVGEEARGFLAAARVVETVLGKKATKELKKKLRKVAEFSDLGGGSSFQQATPKSIEILLNEVGVPRTPSAERQASNLILSLLIDGDKDKLAFVLARSANYRTLLASSSR